MCSLWLFSWRDAQMLFNLGARLDRAQPAHVRRVASLLLVKGVTLSVLR
jgi:hypothetical protein